MPVGRGFRRYGKYSRRGFRRFKKYQKKMELNYKDFFHSTVAAAAPVLGSELTGFFDTASRTSIDDSPRFVGFRSTPANTSALVTIDDCALTAIPLGTNVNTRIGRKILVKNIAISGKVYAASATANEVPSGAPDTVRTTQVYSHLFQQGICHMALVCHAANQGAAANPLQLYVSMNSGGDTNEGVTMHRQKDFTASYKILKKWKRKIVWLQYDSGAVQGSRGYAVMDKVVRVNKLVSYYPSDVNGTVGGTADNVLYLAVWFEQMHADASGAASIMARVNFYDV